MMKKIVAAIINHKIVTNDAKHMVAALELKLPIIWLHKGELEIMAACDLGPRWETLANSRTLFLMDGKGKPHAYNPPP